MIKYFLILPLLLFVGYAEELKVISNTFKADQQKGVSLFTGNVQVTKGKDELNASKVTIFTDQNKKPIKYLAEGDVSFYIITELKEIYRGKAQTAIFLPNEGEYHFYTKVDLIRLDDYRRIKGDKVVVNTVVGNASAESTVNDPVIMTFTLDDKKTIKKSGVK